MAKAVVRLPGSAPYSFIEVEGKDIKEVRAMYEEACLVFEEFFTGDSSLLTPEQVAEELGGGTFVDPREYNTTDDEPKTDLAAKKAAMLKGAGSGS